VVDFRVRRGKVI